jgi:hypothetical protein
VGTRGIGRSASRPAKAESEDARRREKGQHDLHNPASVGAVLVTAAGETAKKYAAHLVPSGKWLNKGKEIAKRVQELHEILKDAGLGVNDAVNGLFTNSARHLGTHTFDFIRYLHKQLTPLAGNSSAITAKLTEIADLLKRGKLKF